MKSTDELIAAGEARLIRKLDRLLVDDLAPGIETLRALYIDVETTGLEDDDEVIELAAVPFDFSRDGIIRSVGAPFQRYRHPRKPISPEITALTGITPEMVAGQRIDDADLVELLSGVALVVAHNAEFDRGHCERLSPIFRPTLRWACSMSEVDWRGVAGYEGRTLGYLVMQAGWFYDRHRAVMDCFAGVKLLSLECPVSGRTGMAHLLDSARQRTHRVVADNSPFKLKGQLKARGYHWEPERKVWWRDVAEGALGAELEWLRRDIYQISSRQFQLRMLTAAERFSRRAWEGEILWR